MVIRRFFLLLAAFILFFNAASAGIEWPEETNGQKVLKQYIESVNSFLTQLNLCIGIAVGSSSFIQTVYKAVHGA